MLSLARLLHYTKCEADALGQTAAAALVDAALLSLTVNSSPVSAAASGSRLRGLLTDQPPPQTRKFC